MSQRQVQVIHQEAKSFAYRLRYFFGQDAALVAKCGSDLADEIMRSVCDRLGLDSGQANNAGHPWQKRGYNRGKKAKSGG